MTTCNVLLAQDANQVIIKGEMRGDLKGHNKVHLFTRTERDSAIIKDGKYTFSFPFTEMGMRMIYPEYVQKAGMMYRPFGVFISGPGTYYITADVTGMYETAEVRGPSGAVIYRQFERDNDGAMTKINHTLGDLYGNQWYTIREDDPRYANFRKSQDSLTEMYLMPVLENTIRSHPDEKVTGFILQSAGRNIGSTQKMEELYSLLSPEVQKSEAAKKYKDYITGLKSSGVGSKVANFILPDPDGNDVDFADFKGKYVLIDFWASWCAPCRKSFPSMRKFYQETKGDKFEIYSISIDESKPDWLRAIKEENNPWPQSLDTKNISQSGFAVTGIPTIFLIDPEGIIVAKEIGFDPDGGSEIEKIVREITGKPAVTAKPSKERANKKSPGAKGNVVPAIRMQ